MLKDLPPKESSGEKAKRMWRNNAARQRIMEKRAEAKKVVAEAEAKEPPKVADVIANDGILHGSIRHFESQFKRDIRAMLQGHVDKNLMLYAATLQHRKRRLLVEKLRRLEAQL
jgi:hypothetical protein